MPYSKATSFDVRGPDFAALAAHLAAPRGALGAAAPPRFMVHKKVLPPLPLLLRIPLPYRRCAPLPLSKRARRTTRSTSSSASPAARAQSPTPAGAARPPAAAAARPLAGGLTHTQKQTSGRRSGARRRYHDTLSFWHLEYFYWAESVFRLYNIQQAARPTPAALRFFGTLSEYRNDRVRHSVGVSKR